MDEPTGRTRPTPPPTPVDDGDLRRAAIRRRRALASGSGGELAPGTRLTPDLQVVRRLGGGGQGEVYELGDVRTAKRWAAKVLPADLEQRASHFARFRREAELASTLRHPNLVRSFGLERATSGRYFLRMELLVGVTFADLVAAGPVPVERALDLFAGVALALSALHGSGIVHRDLKPCNLFVVETPRGSEVKLMDLGIAKTDDSWDHTKLTVPGAILGTPLYMSPEQILAPDTVTAASDLYALGLVLYELLAGRPPFAGKSVLHLMEQQIYAAPPDPRLWRPELPERLAQVVLRALAKAPAERYPSAEVFLARVDAARRRGPPVRRYASVTSETSPPAWP